MTEEEAEYMWEEYEISEDPWQPQFLEIEKPGYETIKINPAYSQFVDLI